MVYCYVGKAKNLGQDLKENFENSKILATAELPENVELFGKNELVELTKNIQYILATAPKKDKCSKLENVMYNDLEKALFSINMVLCK